MSIRFFKGLLWITLCCLTFQANAQSQKAYSFFVGTFEGKVGSKGIYKFKLDSRGQFTSLGLAGRTQNPSYITFSDDRKFLLSVSLYPSFGPGIVESFLRTKRGLKPVSKSPTDKAPCFVAVRDNHVLVANYSGGSTELFKLGPNGKLTHSLSKEQHEGKGVNNRQEAPHSHSAWFSPDSNVIISPDLGTNHLWFSELNTGTSTLDPRKQEKLKMKEGAGPRHLAFHPLHSDWIYVVNELDNTISLVKINEKGKYKVFSSISTLPKNTSGNNVAADIGISSDGKFLYATNRGVSDSIVIYKINEHSGELTLVGFEDVRGDFPRHFAFSPNEEFIVVANQNSNTLESYKRNKLTGKLTFTDKIKTPNPTCILF
ncbi:lactonase family protein [Aquimarina agarilytica]|uniref:lactonase family protein n=1 Tax=Aquimarina agarilytica TaxID=1087449 RepID=UPI000288FD98|nr:lactonase family protein [Aquimarina agarilytica]